MTKQGFSLIETMIVVGIMGVIALGSMRFIIQQGKTISLMEDRLSRVTLETQLSQELRTDVGCQANLVGLDLTSDGAQLIDLKRSDGSIRYSATHAILSQYDQLKIDQISIRNISVPGPNSSGEVEVEIRTRRQRNNVHKEMRPIQMRFLASTDASNRISHCGKISKATCGSHIEVTSFSSLTVGSFANCCPGGGPSENCYVTGVATLLNPTVWFACSCD
ncbi:MAG: prepilin-type N-terminal cleavage/methylation domain-containing protein [Pseudomonadota bacterium]